MNSIKKIQEKYGINFQQSKYKVALVMYIPIYLVGCLFIYAFSPSSSTATNPENRNDYLDGNVPQPTADSIMGEKGTDADYSMMPDEGTELQTVDNDSLQGKNSVDASFGEHDDGTAAMKERIAQQEAQRAQLENYRQMQNRVRSSSGSRVDGGSDYTAPLSQNDIARAQQRRRERLMRSIDDDLYDSRDRQIAGTTGKGRHYNPVTGKYEADDSGREPLFYDRNGNPVYSPDDIGGQNGDQNGQYADGQQNGRDRSGKTAKDKTPVEEVHKIRSGSDYFNTLSSNTDDNSLITAIIDENIKAIDGSRVRLKLLDDCQVGKYTIPKGTRLYVTMSGFSSQRVKGTVKSVLLGDKIINISLAIYDMDGLEGLYVPESSFREIKKDIGESVTQGGTNFNTIDGYGSNNVLKSWGSQAVQNASQKAMDLIQKRIQKNVVKLKFGTRVYLINSDDIVDAGER